jgi:hypothetical protein
MNRWVCLVGLLAVTLPQVGWADPHLEFSLKLKEEQSSIQDANAALRQLGILEQLPERLVLDLSLPGRVLQESYWSLSDLAQKAGFNLDSEASIRGACFTGDGRQVPKRLGYLSDGWLSEQFTMVRAVTNQWDHVDILFYQDDDGTDRRWLRLNRCP